MKFIAIFLSLFLSSELFASGNITFNGYVDSNFTYNQDNSSTSAINLNAAQLTANLKDGNCNGVVQLLYGNQASAFNSANFGPATSYVEQAYLTLSKDKATLKVGKFIGFMSMELPDSISNWNYSHSLVFFNTPAYHIGAQLAYSPLNDLIITGSLLNENSSDYSLDNSRDYAVSATYIYKLLILTSHWYVDNSDLSVSNNLLNPTLLLTLNDNVSVAGDYIYTTSTLQQTQGYSGYLNFSLPYDITFSPRWSSYAYSNRTTNQTTLTIKKKFDSVTGILEYNNLDYNYNFVSALTYSF